MRPARHLYTLNRAPHGNRKERQTLHVPGRRGDGRDPLRPGLTPDDFSGSLNSPVDLSAGATGGLIFLLVSTL